MPQYGFSTDEDTIKIVDEIADREKRSRSEVLELLVKQALRERERNRNKKKKNQEDVQRDNPQ